MLDRWLTAGCLNSAFLCAAEIRPESVWREVGRVSFGCSWI